MIKHLKIQRSKPSKTLSLLVVGFFGLSNISAMPVFGADGAAVSSQIDVESNVDTISMSFDGASLKDVLLLFSQQSGLNFVASSDVESKKVTVYFENVSPKDALDAIITANGLAYSKNPGSDIYIVTPASKSAGTSDSITRVIRLKYMRLSTSPLDIGGQATIDDLKKSASTSSSSASSSSGGSSSGGASSGGAGGGGADKGVDKLIAKMLSSSGKLSVDIFSNSLIITDTPAKIDAIEKVLAQIDVPTSQVVLEVYVMEVSKGIASDVGIEWGGTSGALFSYNGGARTTAFPFREQWMQHTFGPNSKQGEIPTVEASSTAALLSGQSALGPQMMFGLIDASNFAATLHYIESDSRTKLLARPRVLTQNNEAASIQVTTNQTTFQTEAASTSNSVTTTGTTNERTEVGISLHLTPQINEDDSVLIFLEPAVTSVARSAAFPTALDPTTRLVRTMARIKDNQTLVIGGLIDSNDSVTKKKVPFLGDLPGLGRAFRYDSVDNSERELLIFVTPHIVRGASSLGQHSATAKGADLSMRRVLDQFIDKEMDGLAGDFQQFEKTNVSFFTSDQQLVMDTEKRFSNPLVNKQMTQALDALSPQLVDTQMNQSLDSISGKKYHN